MDEYFTTYSSTRKAYTEHLVAGGGLPNGNAYATVEEHDDRVLYREHGSHPYEEVYEDHHLEHDEYGFTTRRNQ